MRMRARVLCIYENDAVSRSIASALQPDNLPTKKGVWIETHWRGKQVITKVDIDGRIETLLATLDDLLSCTSAAESML